MAEPCGAVLDVVIVEDEERAMRTLRGLLEADPEVRLVGETSGASAPGVIRERRPDIVFLDVQMPGMDGFEVLRSLDLDPMPIVVFVTAYDEYALEAFDVAAVDYLLKPFSDHRFREALDRAKERARGPELAEAARALARLAETLDAGEPEPGSPPDRLLVRGRGRTMLVDPEEIDWIEAAGVYVRIHAGGRVRLLRETLNHLEERLAPHGFFRIHRSTLVNLERVAELRHRSHGDYAVLLEDGTELTLSRTRRAALEEALGGSLS